MDSIDDRTILHMYEVAQRIRMFESTVISMFRDGNVPGFSHTYIGQEAVAAGVCEALEIKDRITSTHRGHGHLLAKGAEAPLVMAEILGRTSGYCKGMAGELHIVDAEHGVIGLNGIVGGGIPMAAGAALADTVMHRDHVTVCFFGEGATSEGAFAETLNLAAVWNLPVIFVCENNLYCQWTPARDVCAGNLHERALAHGVPGHVVDGQDAMAVYAVARDAVGHARSGGGPSFIEAMTYRWHGHAFGEEAIIGTFVYRAPAEVDEWRANRDPIEILRNHCLALGRITSNDLDAIDAMLREELAYAREFAEESALPVGVEALEHVFGEPMPGPESWANAS